MKTFLAPQRHRANIGIYETYPIDDAAWVWHPDCKVDEPCFLSFKKTFSSHDESLKIHLSADQRYELFLDGKRISRGPDRSDLDHWSFNSYDINLSEGEHELEAFVWWLGDHAPEALIGFRGGFILKAEGLYDEDLTTGKAAWSVYKRKGWSLEETPIKNFYMVIGDSITLDAKDWFDLGEASKVLVVRAPVRTNPTGICTQGWRLNPSTLLDQVDASVTQGSIRAVIEGVERNPIITDEHVDHANCDRYQSLLTCKDPFTVPANTEVSLLWDLEDYYCGYASVSLSQGTGATVGWYWAEGLFEPNTVNKGNRNEIISKQFIGFGDRFIADGHKRQFAGHWWRSGRYVLLTVKTLDEPLLIESIALNETRYPLENVSAFESNQDIFETVTDLSVRVLQMCSHETYMDCPYYEQLMYVGDTRLEMLATYITSADDRLVRRGIELFDYSRHHWGFTTERYTSRNEQLSPTFSLIWIWLIHDYLYWRDDALWVQDRLIGARSSLENFLPYLNADGLLEKLPGWTFVDWPDEWDTGYPPGARENVSSVVNLHYLLSLQKLADIEGHLGEVENQQKYTRMADALKAQIMKTFWVEEKGLLADDIPLSNYSEHAQCLGILGGVFDESQQERVFDTLCAENDLVKTTVYFRFYLFEVFKQLAQSERMLPYFDFWVSMKEIGLKTTLEKPEPSRSDCHAWGAHPLFHMHASLLGLRPTSPGFKTLEIKPQPGDLPIIRSLTPHPHGEIKTDLNFENGCRGTVELPSGTEGTFIFAGQEVSLKGGQINKLDIA